MPSPGSVGGGSASSRPAPAAGGTAAPGAAAVGWGDVVAASEALAEAERPVEPQVGDLLQHPALGWLEVIDVEPTRLEVRDRARNRRKLARSVLDLRPMGERDGRRALRVRVRSGS